jgi:hypothetical protein
LAIQAVKVMARAWNAQSLAVASRSGINDWARRHRLINEARSLDSLELIRAYQEEPELTGPAAEWLGPFDRVVSFLGGPDEPVTRALKRVLSNRLIAIDPRPAESTLRFHRHITSQWLAAAGLSDGLSIPEPSISDYNALRTGLASRLATSPSKEMILIHPGSGGLSKCCPLEAMETLIRFVRRPGIQVAWMIGPDEVERFGKSYRARLEQTTTVLLEEDVGAAADLVAGADAYVGNDAGMTHVAAWSGVPTVVLFGPTDPRVWRPWGRNVRAAPFPNESDTHEHWAAGLIESLCSESNQLLSSTASGR